MKLVATLLLLCAVAGLALASGSGWSSDTTTPGYSYYDPSSTTQASVTTEAPQSPCGGNILGPCGKLGGKKLYFFY